MNTSEEIILYSEIANLLENKELSEALKKGKNINKSSVRVELLKSFKVRILYNKFDREAYHRENEYLRRMLMEEDNHP